MSLVRRDNNGNTPTTARYVRDPFALARELFNWDVLGDQRQPSTFNPGFEVKETPEQFIVRADVPGVKEEDVDVSVHNGVLTITGRRLAEERREGESYYLFERQYGAFSRSFALPDTADSDKVEAKLDQGVLTLTIGKRVDAKPKKISFKKS
jgi:HSP20 family protein